MKKGMKYRVTWMRPPQLDGASRLGEIETDSAKGAYWAMVGAETEPGCSQGKAYDASGSRVSFRQLRAWGRIVR